MSTKKWKQEEEARRKAKETLLRGLATGKYSWTGVGSPNQITDFEPDTVVIGTRDDYFRTLRPRPCRDCGELTYTSKPYPAGMPLICEICGAKMVSEEIGLDKV